MESVGDKINYPWKDITDPLYLPLKRGGLVCPPLEGPMISNELEKEWNLWEIKLIIRESEIRVGKIIYPSGEIIHLREK